VAPTRCLEAKEELVLLEAFVACLDLAGDPVQLGLESVLDGKQCLGVAAAPCNAVPMKATCSAKDQQQQRLVAHRMKIFVFPILSPTRIPVA
jgi:hypothetical protein